jgi:formylglycine-generating enzyme required for sulfatase activity
MKRLLILFTILALLMGACGSADEPEDTAEEKAEQATVAFKTPLPQATEAKVLPTNTPVPPPPTPTPQPTPTTQPTPEPEPTATPAQAATQETAEEATQAPTEVPSEEPSPTPAPLPAVTDVMVEIPAGTFMMGSDDGGREDKPAHEVDLPAYEIDKFEVTNTDFAVFVQSTGYQTDAEKQDKQSWRDAFKEGREAHPVVKVTWNDAVAYCEWAGKRLPTEAEWEKAARGAEALRYPWGNEWDPSKANVKETGLRSTAVVGSFGAGASPFGVEDMVGNVWEWTSDWYQAYPGNTSGDRYYGEQCRVTRGGGWFDDEPQATTFNRNCGVPDKTINDDLGFRCARSK